MGETNLFLIFLTGLTTGGLTCVALQGGLLASTLKVENEYQERSIEDGKVARVLFFLVAKLVAYTFLGFLLGLIGSAVTLSPQLRGVFQIVIGIYLLGVAGSILRIHPIFRYFVITPPRFLTRLIRKESKGKSLFAPIILGAMTIFIPCATTQAMEIVALGTGNALHGAMIMFAFVLGTSPTFLLLGILYSKASERFSNYFDKVAAVLLLFLAIFSVNGGLGVMGSLYTMQNFWKVATISSSFSQGMSEAKTINGAQEIALTVSDHGYSPTNIKIRKGVRTKVKLVTSNTQGCARAFSVPQLKLQKILPETGVEVIEFTPEQSGPLVFSCSMGMYTGIFHVI